MTSPEVALVVREPWASLLVDGAKTLELRRKATARRGRVCVASGGQLLGEVTVQGSSFLTLSALAAREPEHRVPMEAVEAYASALGGLHAWRLGDATRYPDPRPYLHRRGAVGWVRLRSRSPRRDCSVGVRSGSDGGSDGERQR